MSDSEDLSVEYKVLTSETQTLNTGCRQASHTLCRALFSKGLIPTEVERMCNDTSVRNDDFVHRMVTTLQDRVRNDPKAFNIIVELLKKETGISYLGEILEKKKEEMMAQERERQEAKRELEAEKEKMEDKKKRETEQRIAQPTQWRSTLATYDEEVRHAIPLQHQHARSTPVEYVYMSPLMMPFGGQKQVSSNIGGDFFLQPPLPEHVMNTATGMKSKTESELHTGSLQPSCSSDGQTVLPTNHVMKKTCGNEGTQSLDTRDMRVRSESNTSSSSNSSEYKTPPGSPHTFRTSPRETTEDTSAECQILKCEENQLEKLVQKQKNSKEKPENYLRELHEKEQEIERLQDKIKRLQLEAYNQFHWSQQMESKMKVLMEQNRELKSKLEKQVHKNEILKHERDRERADKLKEREEKRREREEKIAERALKEKECALKEKERREREKEREEQEKEWEEQEKEREENEREEKEIERELKLSIEKKLHETQARSLQSEGHRLLAEQLDQARSLQGGMYMHAATGGQKLGGIHTPSQL